MVWWGWVRPQRRSKSSSIRPGRIPGCPRPTADGTKSLAVSNQFEEIKYLGIQPGIQLILHRGCFLMCSFADLHTKYDSSASSSYIPSAEQQFVNITDNEFSLVGLLATDTYHVRLHTYISSFCFSR